MINRTARADAAMILLLACSIVRQAATQELPTILNNEIKPDYFEEMTFPLNARLTHTEGTVVILANLNEQGRVIASTALSGAKALIPEAVSNSKRWRFQPNSRKSVILVYVFRIEGVCHLPCRSQFLFHPPNLATITIGEPTIEPERANDTERQLRK